MAQQAVHAVRIFLAIAPFRAPGDREGDRDAGAVADQCGAMKGTCTAWPGSSAKSRPRPANSSRQGRLRWPPLWKRSCSSAGTTSRRRRGKMVIVLVPRTWSRILCSGSKWSGVTEPGELMKTKPPMLEHRRRCARRPPRPAAPAPRAGNRGRSGPARRTSAPSTSRIPRSGGSSPGRERPLPGAVSGSIAERACRRDNIRRRPGGCAGPAPPARRAAAADDRRGRG